MVATGKAIRRLRFFLLERVVLPLVILPLRAWMRTWRASGPDAALVAQLATRPRLIFTVFHGMFVEGLVYSGMWRPYGRRFVVLTTPSLDGKLATKAIAHLGLASAPLLEGQRGVAAAREFVARVEQGDIGVILVDGPRGPSGVVKPGVAATIQAAGAEVVVTGFASSSGMRLGSWDRMFLPAPFARVHFTIALLATPSGAATPGGEAIQDAMDVACAQAWQVIHGGLR